MLHFLRRIRRNLIGTGATSKYLLYAVGEIGLVVIGILIALSINNWNEDKKLRQKEHKVLLEIRQNLERNLLTLTDRMKMENGRRQYIDNILDDIKNNKNSDSLGFWIAWAGIPENINLITSAYESLKSIGFDIIKSDTLRNELMRFFGHLYPSSKDVLKTLAVDQLDKFTPYQTKHTTNIKSEVRDYELLRNDLDFKSILYQRRGLKNDVYTSISNGMSRMCEDLIKMIDHELERW